MSTISCSELQENLEGWLEGRRSPEQESHVRGCAHCRGVLTEVDAIITSARTFTDEEAPERVWTSLRSELEKEGLIRDREATAPQRWTRWLEGVFESVPRPAIAGAYVVALLALSVSMVGPGPVQKHFQSTLAQAATNSPLSAQLDTAEQDAISSLSNSNPAVSASLQGSLAILDKDISLCEKGLQEDPNDEAARDYLYEAYQEKSDLLAEISERGAFGQ
jgi:hypothetical protein